MTLQGSSAHLVQHRRFLARRQHPSAPVLLLLLSQIQVAEVLAGSVVHPLAFVALPTGAALLSSERVALVVVPAGEAVPVESVESVAPAMRPVHEALALAAEAVPPPP